MKINWDEAKRLANFEKHGLDFAALDLDFFADAIFRPTHSGRRQALGRARWQACRVRRVPPTRLRGPIGDQHATRFLKREENP